MKKIAFILCSIVSFTSFAQQNTFPDRFSLEAGYGYVMPMGTVENGEAADYSDFKNLHLGAHYLITDVLGARFSYNYADFQNKDSNYYGSTYHRFTLEATYDVYGAIMNQESPFKTNDRFEGIVHAGAGISFSQPDFDKSILDKGVGIQFGIQPKYYITNNLSLFLDATYVMNMMRDYGIDGVSVLDGGSTSYVSAVLGVNYRFGN
jgi:hypothetical protein